jgi:hypothetical protein
VTTGGIIRSESNVRTASQVGRTRAAGDITGAWYDPATNGSGLVFTHSFRTSDTVFGTWYLYETFTGNSRWYSIQNAVWQNGGTQLTGDLFDSRAGAFICDSGSCPPPIRPAPVFLANKIGTVRISFISIGPYSDTQPQATAEAFSLNNTLLFTSNLIKLAM